MKIIINIIFSALLAGAIWNCSKPFPGDMYFQEFLLSEVVWVSVTPVDGAANIYLDRDVTVTFSEAMDPASITVQAAEGKCTDSIQISRDNFSTCIGGSVSTLDNKTFTVTPLYSFWEESRYKIKVSMSVLNAEGYSRMLMDYTTNTGFLTETLPYKSTVQLWYRANAILGTADGAVISTWPDSSPNGWNADPLTAATPANSPVFTANAIQGKPAVSFASIDQDNFTVTSAANGLSNAASGITGFVVFNITSSADPDILNTFDISQGTSPGTSRFNLLRTTPNAHRVEGREKDSDGLLSVSAGSYTSNVFTMDTGIIDFANDDMFLYNNGTLIASNTSLLWTTGFGATCENTDSARMTIGSGAGYGEFLTGQIADIIIFNSTLTTSQREAVECFLGRKYAITIDTGIVCP